MNPKPNNWPDDVHWGKADSVKISLEQIARTVFDEVGAISPDLSLHFGDEGADQIRRLRVLWHELNWAAQSVSGYEYIVRLNGTELAGDYPEDDKKIINGKIDDGFDQELNDIIFYFSNIKIR